MFNANAFVRVAKKVSSVVVVEMTPEDIKHRNAEMDLAVVFENAASIPGISKFHCIRLKDGVPEAHVLTKHSNCGTALPLKQPNKPNSKEDNFYYQVYGSSSSEDEHEDNLLELSPQQRQPPRLEDIKHGTYVLVQFDGPRKTSYRYLAVCQSDVDSDVP